MCAPRTRTGVYAVRAVVLEQVGRGRLRCGGEGGLARGGAALLEIGGDQGADIRALVAERLPGWSCSVELDLGRLPRVAIVRREEPAGDGPG